MLKNIGIDDAIKNLETSNEGLKITLEQLGEQFKDLNADPEYEGLMGDLEDLAFNYLKTWISSNTEIIEILNKAKK